MESETVLARDLVVGDVVQVDGELGWWTVSAVFVEAQHVIDIDLVRTGDLSQYEAPFQYEWFVALDHPVERMP